jgi:hypothetical protein
VSIGAGVVAGGVTAGGAAAGGAALLSLGFCASSPPLEESDQHWTQHCDAQHHCLQMPTSAHPLPCSRLNRYPELCLPVARLAPDREPAAPPARA